MWNRILNVVDRLIGLLKGAEYAAGESYWDRSMIYVIRTLVARRLNNAPNRLGSRSEQRFTDHFSNGQWRTDFGWSRSEHRLDHGFNPMTGARAWAQNDEPEIFAGILQALGVDTSPLVYPI